MPRGMIDTTNLDTFNANIEAVIDKKFSKLSLADSSNTSSARAKHFSYAICGSTNHDTCYCGSTHSKHVTVVDYEGYDLEAPVKNCDGYGYNAYHVVAVNYCGQGQGAEYVKQPFTYQSYSLRSIQIKTKETSILGIIEMLKVGSIIKAFKRTNRVEMH